MAFDDVSNAFLAWFKSQPGTNFHPSLAIADLRESQAGRGLVATSDIPADTELFIIPRKSIISVETSDLAQKLPQLFASLSKTGDLTDDDDELSADVPIPWLQLILALLYEFCHRDASRWAPYLAALPSTAESFNTLMFWSPKEVAELQVSEIRSKIGRESADKMFDEHILPVVKANADVFYPSGVTPMNDDELRRSCHVVGSLIMSYAFDLQPDEEDEANDEAEDGWVEDRASPSTMGMVPMADMLNADAEFNAHLSHGDDALTMTSLRLIKAGEQVLNYYGPLPNGELLRRYGYTSPKHSRYDVVEINWSLVRDVLQDARQWEAHIASRVSSVIAQLEADGEVDDEDGFVLERNAGDPDEQGLCTALPTFDQFPEELVALVNAVVKKVIREDGKKRKLSSEEQDSAIKHQVLRLLETIALRRLGQYPTSADDDAALLANAPAHTRRKMAIEVRRGEKLVLTEAMTWSREKQQKYAASANGHTGSAHSGASVKKHRR